MHHFKFTGARKYLVPALCAAVLGTAEASTTLEEIIVTAQKREQGLQDVPISVQVVTENDLSTRNTNEVADITRMSPGFTFGDGSSSGDRTLILRGVGTQTFSRGVDQSVSVVVDGAVATGIAASLLDLNDVSRVEILRGPQGMLFGKNASAGVLNVVTNGPTEEFEGILRASYADEGEIKINAIASGPLSDKVSARLGYHSSQHDPILENLLPGGPDYQDRDEWGLRGKLLFDLTDNLDLLLTANHIESDVLCCSQTSRQNLPGSLSDNLGIPAGDEVDTIVENQTSTGEVELDNVVAEFTYDWNESTLTSITSYTETNNIEEFRGFNVPVSFVIDNPSDENITQFTQEFRLLSPGGETFDWLVGAYYFNKELDRDSFQLLDFSIVGLVPPGIIALDVKNSKVDWESYAVFGQGTWNISDRARLTAGLRVNFDDLETTTVVDPPNPALAPQAFLVIPIPGTTPGIASESSSNDALSGRLIFEYDYSDDIMLYASAARGYKGEGANTQSSVIAADVVIVDPEIPTNFELGLRSTLADGRAIFNATLFHSTFENFQATLTETGRLVPEFLLANAEELETQGLEAELAAQVTDNLVFNASLAYISSEFSDFTGAQCYFGQTAAEGCIGGAQDLTGKDLANSPELSYNIGLRYNRPFASLPFEGFLTADWYWQDEVQYTASNNPGTIGDSYGIADASIGIVSNDGSYRISLFVKNLFDEHHVTNLDDRLGGLTGQAVSNRLGYLYERRIGVSAEIRF